MKATSLKTAAIMAASVGLFAGSAMAQGTAVSGVVGYETLDYIGGFNFLGLRLHSAPVASGDLETVTATTAIDADVNLAALLDGSTFILEIEDASGIIQEVTTADGGGTGLAVTDLTGVANGASYTLRPAATLASVFGAANESGLTSNATFGASDQVWLSDGAGGFTKYYYAPADFFNPASWKDSNDAVVTAENVNIVYTDGIILNSQPAGGSLVVTGDLKVAETMVALGDGFNYLGSVYPVGATLESLFGATNASGLTSNATFGASDQIWKSDGAGGFLKYYYAPADFFNPAAWKDSNDAVVTPSTIDVPSGYIINNVGGAQNVLTTAPSFYTGL